MGTKIRRSFITSQRHAGNAIPFKLKDGNGEWIEGNDAMGTLIHDYFSSLFTTKVQQTEGELLNMVIPRVNPEMNASLLKPYTPEEVKEAW
jgi:hypothetical protein